MTTSWVIEVKELLNTSWLLIEIDTDSSYRSAFITIDNGNELFMKYLLKYVKKEKKAINVNYHELIELMKKT